MLSLSSEKSIPPSYDWSAPLTALLAQAPKNCPAATLEQFYTLIKMGPICLERQYMTPGHITGSALVINQAGSQILLNHHRFLDKWLCFGGHADGDADIARVAARELREESGLTHVRPLAPTPVDLDIHAIPANPKKGEGPHLHFDMRFAFICTDNSPPSISDESRDLRWVSWDDVSGYALSADMMRLITAARDLL